MKKIVIAPDKFKGSLSAIEFCELVEKALKRICPKLIIEKCPLADGGDGTVDVLRYHIGGQDVIKEVSDPLFRPTRASYLLSPQLETAFIEMSAASGIRLLKEDELNPLKTTTYGTGELILDAVHRGVKHILLGIGGSATNDAGIGMARALGYRFFDEHHNELKGVGKDLTSLAHIDASVVPDLFKNIKFEVACDVNNPLYGPDGAAFVYGPQKGATNAMIQELDNGLMNFNRLMANWMGVDLQSIKGSGAAGGLGAGCVAFLNASLIRGIDLVMKVADFHSKIQDADWIITGEGQLDEQTLSGKVIKGVMDGRTTQKIAVFCGINTKKIPVIGFDYIQELSAFTSSKEESITKAPQLLSQIAERFARKYLS